MKTLRFSSFTGPAAAMIDMILLLLIFVLSVLLSRPAPGSPQPIQVMLSETEMQGAEAQSEPPLAYLEITPEGVFIGDDPAPVQLENVQQELSPMLGEAGDVLICIHGIPFENHWRIRRIVEEALSTDPFFVPCKEPESP